MRVLLVGPNYEDNLSLRYLSASLARAGHHAEVVGFNSSCDTDAVVARARGFDLVGLSIAFQVRAPEYLALADALGRVGAPLVVAGGHYASCRAEELLERHASIDVIVVHEGEQTIVELADLAADRGRLSDVRGIVFRANDGAAVRTGKRRVLENLDELPFPDRSGATHFFAGVPTAYLMGSRGCVASCDYCCIVTLHRMAEGRRFRQRSPEHIADEMAELYHSRGIRHFIFHDDNFLVPSVSANHRRLDAFERAWRERGLVDLGLTLKCRPPDAERTVLAKLKSMGLLRVFLGIESSSSAGLAAIGREQTVEQAERALAICRELEISAQYTMMIFHPDATLETVRSDLAFMRHHVDHPLNFARTEIYARTPLEERMIQLGRARGDYLARSYRIADARTERASEAVCRIFAERAWVTRGLMDRAIGLDHLSAVLGQFYRGSDVRRLREAIRHWRLEVNHDSITLLEDAVRLAGALEGIELARALDAVAEREAETRPPLLARALELKSELESLVRTQVGLAPDALAPARPTRPRARHAAAVALALGLASCGGSQSGSTLGPPREIHDGVPVPPEPDAGPPGPPDAGPQIPPDQVWHDGIAEAAPMPMKPKGEDKE